MFRFDVSAPKGAGRVRVALFFGIAKGMERAYVIEVSG